MLLFNSYTIKSRFSVRMSAVNGGKLDQPNLLDMEFKFFLDKIYENIWDRRPRMAKV